MDPEDNDNLSELSFGGWDEKKIQQCENLEIQKNCSLKILPLQLEKKNSQKPKINLELFNEVSLSTENQKFESVSTENKLKKLNSIAFNDFSSDSEEEDFFTENETNEELI
ncbi:hypothetical protein PPERSA_02699 [Pseudocohnilembus persalinus]|uniref:Uncharacterized protein n=1 Tax=Pseudocohnilembus persalinus TaxID=266149 RepID=A0A0V0R5S0_PSEPJ|nr:hypothetical protein PPERSA_02699 [Pseudocohnilembus persalinus]|eukprot:KRX09827.1 hypothetical protein PPERSA_02699 [Pseudocohnilembus persalinus]